MAVVELTTEQLAYFAGIFDGEGCVCISKRSRKYDGHYTLEVGVGNCYLPLMEDMCLAFGGTVKLHRQQNPRPVYYWRVGANIALKFLIQVYPYLTIKKKQAEIAIEFQQKRKKTKGRIPEEEVKFRKDCHDKVIYLNKGGY